MQVVRIAGSAGTPFRLNSLPQHAFAHAGWMHAEQQALATIGHRQRLLLLGRAGTGKSLLLRSLDATLKSQGVNVHYLHGGELPNSLIDEDVLLVDEVVFLTGAELERLLQLPNPLVMAGLPSLPGRLSSCLGTFHSVTLEPLAPEDVARFVVAQLVASGRSRKTFTPDALIKLAYESNGLLRLVIVLAGAALFFAEHRGAMQVTNDDVSEAVKMRTILPDETKQPVTSGKEVTHYTVDFC